MYRVFRLAEVPVEGGRVREVEDAKAKECPAHVLALDWARGRLRSLIEYTDRTNEMQWPSISIPTSPFVLFFVQLIISSSFDHLRSNSYTSLHS